MEVKITVKVTAILADLSAEIDGSPVTEFDIEHSVREAVVNSLGQSERNGFSHKLSDILSLKIDHVELD